VPLAPPVPPEALLLLDALDELDALEELLLLLDELDALEELLLLDALEELLLLEELEELLLDALEELLLLDALDALEELLLLDALEELLPLDALEELLLDALEELPLLDAAAALEELLLDVLDATPPVPPAPEEELLELLAPPVPPVPEEELLEKPLEVLTVLLHPSERETPQARETAPRTSKEARINDMVPEPTPNPGTREATRCPPSEMHGIDSADMSLGVRSNVEEPSFGARLLKARLGACSTRSQCSSVREDGTDDLPDLLRPFRHRQASRLGVQAGAAGVSGAGHDPEGLG
jgi:hypothetical protein